MCSDSHHRLLAQTIKTLGVPLTCCPETNCLILPTPRYLPAGWGFEKNPPQSVLEGLYGIIYYFHVKCLLSANHCARCQNAVTSEAGAYTAHLSLSSKEEEEMVRRSHPHKYKAVPGMP